MEMPSFTLEKDLMMQFAESHPLVQAGVALGIGIILSLVFFRRTEELWYEVKKTKHHTQ